MNDLPANHPLNFGNMLWKPDIVPAVQTDDFLKVVPRAERMANSIRAFYNDPKKNSCPVRLHGIVIKADGREIHIDDIYWPENYRPNGNRELVNECTVLFGVSEFDWKFVAKVKSTINVDSMEIVTTATDLTMRNVEGHPNPPKQVEIYGFNVVHYETTYSNPKGNSRV